MLFINYFIISYLQKFLVLQRDRIKITSESNSAAFDHHDILKVRKKYMVKAVCIGTTLKNPGKKKKNRWTLL